MMTELVRKAQNELVAYDVSSNCFFTRITRINTNVFKINAVDFKNLLIREIREIRV
jgi:hypothetical protein